MDVMENVDYMGETTEPTEKIKSQITINIIEGKQYYKHNVNTYVVVEIPPYFHGKTETRKMTTSPSYFKTFIIDLPSILLNYLLKLHIIVTVHESSTILGSTVIEIFTVWSEPGKMFRNKWLTLINREKNDLSIKGYLKCDLFMFYDIKSTDKLILPKPLNSTFEDFEINENDLLIPNGFKMGSTHLAKYSIGIYTSEIGRYLFDNKGVKWLSIDFGEAPESSILLSIKETESNWSQEYSTTNIYPPLCPTIVFKFIFSGKVMASRTLSMYNFIGKDGLPCFGPAFLHFTSLKTQQYFGRILVSVKTELVPSEIENTKTLQIKTVSNPVNELMYFKVVIIGLVFCVNEIRKTLVKSKNIAISMDYGKYNFASGYENKTELDNMQTSEFEKIDGEDDFCRLSFGEDATPSLFLATNLSSAEYYAMFAMNLCSITVHKMKTCISRTLKHLDYQQLNNAGTNKINYVRQMFVKIDAHYQRFKQLYNQNFYLQRHIHTPYVNHLKLFHTLCLEEVKKVSTLIYNESDVFISTNKIKDILEQLLIEPKLESYNNPPNISLNLCDSKKNVLRCQIETRHFLYSNISDLKGKFCGQIQPWFLATEEKDNIFDGIIETIFWIGPYEDFYFKTNTIPGIFFNNCDHQSCLQYKCNVYNQTLIQFKAHISQVALTEKCYKQFGKLNLMIRVMFNGHSMATEVIDSNASPSWNESIVFEPTVFTRYGDPTRTTPIYAIAQLCRVHLTKKKGPVENVIGFTVLDLKETGAASRSTLNWFDVLDRSGKIGKIFMAVEFVKISDRPAQAENEGSAKVPLMDYVRPKLRIYRLIVRFWGLRQTNLRSSLGVAHFVRILCSDVNVDSEMIKNVASFPNFPNMTDDKYTLSVELPEDTSLISPISFQLFTVSKVKKTHVSVGISSCHAVDRFLVPVIPQSEWNKLKSDHPIDTVLEIEEADDKTEKTRKKPNNQIAPNIRIKRVCDFLKETFDRVIPSSLKPIISFIIKLVLIVLKLLFNAFIYVCPCIESIIYWISKNIQNYSRHFQARYSLIDDVLEEDENEFNWWTKYYGYKYQKLQNSFKTIEHSNTFSSFPCKFLPFCECCKESNKAYFKKRYAKIKSTIIYDNDLESVPEFNRFEDNIKKFKIYGFNKSDKISSVIAILKGNVLLYPKLTDNDEQNFLRSQSTAFSNVESRVWPELKLNAKCKVIARVYILKANNLHPSDISGLSDPYVEIWFGKSLRISDHKNYVPKTLNPIFGRCYEKEISLPECSTLKVRIMDYDMVGKNELIGETIIDIESRYYSKHRAHCGLPKQYDKDGYNRWRDSVSPSNILHKLCTLHSLKPPLYTKHSVKIGSKTFYIDDKHSKINRQSLALHVLNHWQEMPVIGCHLVPEHVETRTLHNPNVPRLHQGTLEMWVDLFSKDDYVPDMVDITPPTIENYELRVIIWSVVDVKLVDENYFTKEKHSDIYIKGWLPGVDNQQSTDVHYRSLNGEGLFNWRMKFSLHYNRTENVIVRKAKNAFSVDHEEERFLPKLHLQIWDNERISPDSYIGLLILDLWNMPRGTRSPWHCTIATDHVPRINVFRIKKTRGWWPFVSVENNKSTIVGKIDAEIQLMTMKEAEKLPAGYGRNEPQPLPEPKRPSAGYFKMIMNPLTFVLRRFFKNNKKMLVVYTLLVSFTLFALLFIYAIPGYLAKILLHA